MRVCVIGAGVIGAAISEELASRGAQVTTIDMRSPGRGASQASAGLLTPYIEGRGEPELLELCARSLEMYDAFVGRVRERTGLDVEYRRDGTLEIAVTDGDVSRLRDIHASLKEDRVAADWLDARQVSALEPAVTPDAAAGLFIPMQGFVAVSALVKALVQSARLQGAQFTAPAEAVRVEATRDGVEVRSETEVVRADAAVVAAGSWSSRLRVAGLASIPVRPIRGQLVQLTWAGDHLPTRPVWGTRVYTVPWQPDTLLVGATVEDVGFDERSTAAGVQELLAAVGELLPAARASAIADIRVGLRPSSSNGLPIVGPIDASPRIHLATGHYRNGVLLAPWTAKKIADGVLA